MTRHNPVDRLLALLTLVLTLASAAQAQTTWYVDDDAPGDPGPGDPSVSDPLEDGSAEHPFDAIFEAIFVTADGDTVLALDGRYTGTLNKNLSPMGKAITVRSQNGPDNCIIDCEYDGRGFHIASGETADSIIDGFTITNGFAGLDGGGIYCRSASPTIANCAILANTATFRGAGVFCDLASPSILRCTISGNMSESGGGGIGLYRSSSPAITGCTITDNRALGSVGGGLLCGPDCDPAMIGCTLSGNSAHGGGGVYCASDGAQIVSCTITGNVATFSGGGIYCFRRSPTIANCTFSANEAHYSGGAICCWQGAEPTIVNCILWGDHAEGSDPEIYGWSGLPVTYSDVQGGWPGEGNIDADPLFAAPDTGDYHLAVGSPCIDAGAPDVVPAPDDRDIDGQLRVWDGDADGQWRVDMGSDEFASHCLGDLDGDGDVGLEDLATLLANYGTVGGVGWEDGDLDLDDDVDVSDLAALLSVYGRGRK